MGKDYSMSNCARTLFVTKPKEVKQYVVKGHVNDMANRLQQVDLKEKEREKNIAENLNAR